MTTKTPREVIARFGLGNGRTIGLERARGIEHFLTAAGYTVEKGWQPITDTEPPECEPVILARFMADDGYGGSLWETFAGERTDNGSWLGHVDGVTGLLPHGYPPHRWRPLPAPPAEKDNGNE